MGSCVILELFTPDATWSSLPRQLPTAEGLTDAEWFAGIVEQYAGPRPALDADQVGALRTMLDQAREQILPGDLATLVYRPADVPVTAIVHVQVLPSESEDPRALVWALMPMIDMALRPVVDDFETPTLGIGRKGAFISADRFADDVTAGGLSYAFPTEHGIVHVFTNPSTPTVIGLLEAQLDEIVRTISLRVDDGADPR